MPQHYLRSGLFKALGEGLPPSTEPSSKPSIGPRGGQIKRVSPTTGKPIYFKKWGSGQGYNPHSLINKDKGGYEIYKKGSIIGDTKSGHPIHSDTGVNDRYKSKTRNYQWQEHIDAHQAHFALAQSIKNLIMERLMAGGDTSKLHGRYDAHMNFSGHHYKEALLDLIHGEKEPVSQEDLGKRERTGSAL